VARERVITGEAVEVELPLARLATRTAAIAIDAFIEVVVIGLPLLLLTTTALASFNADAAVTGAAITVLIVLVFLVLPVTFETLTRGRSPGKFALGLRVVRDDGGPIRFRHAFVRGLVGLVIEWPGLLMLGVSWIFGAWSLLLSRRAKRIGDIAAGTIVLQERLPDRGRYVAAMPAALAPWAATLDLTRVSDDLALTVRQYLSRAHELHPGPRAAIGQKLADELRGVTTPPPPLGTSGWWYLAAVIAERRHRHEQRLARQRHASSLGFPAMTAPAPVGYAPRPGMPYPPAPAYPQPGYPQPGYPQPAYGQPAYGQPAYPQPAYGQPAATGRPGLSSEPAPATPAAGQPGPAVPDAPALPSPSTGYSAPE
jgi:uncharacterized RDD family membrane protein YckC